MQQSGETQCILQPTGTHFRNQRNTPSPGFEDLDPPRQHPCLSRVTCPSFQSNPTSREPQNLPEIHYVCPSRERDEIKWKRRRRPGHTARLVPKIGDVEWQRDQDEREGRSRTEVLFSPYDPRRTNPSIPSRDIVQETRSTVFEARCPRKDIPSIKNDL